MKWAVLVAALVVVAGGVGWFASGIPIAGIRTFYVASEAMEPTLQTGDRFMAAVGGAGDLRRGQIVLVDLGTGDVYVKRLAALGGDRVSLSRGVVTINGRPVQLVQAGTRRVAYRHASATQARLFREQFPGEAAPHMIQDLGLTAEDDMAEVVIGRGRVFLLGDNRDDSADSRVPRVMGGLEQVPVTSVIGQPIFLYWPPKKLGSSPQELTSERPDIP